MEKTEIEQLVQAELQRELKRLDDERLAKELTEKEKQLAEREAEIAKKEEELAKAQTPELLKKNLVSEKKELSKTQIENIDKLLKTVKL